MFGFIWLTIDNGEFVVDKPGRCKVVFYFGAVNFKIVPVSVATHTFAASTAEIMAL